MQKIKNSIIDKMIAAKVTSKEFDFVIYLSRFQNSRGRVAGIHYKELCEEMGMSYQSFYDVKQSLVEKGIISSESSERGDHDIVILDNEFRNEFDVKAGYINTNHNIFFMQEFYELKAGAKLLAAWLMKVCFAGKSSFEIRLEKFYSEEYLEKFGVSKRMLHYYLMSLKNAELFSVGVKDGKYYITPKKIVYKKSDAPEETERMRCHQTEVVLRRNRIKQPESGKKEIYDLIKQYEAKAVELKKDLVKLLDAAVKKSLEIKNQGEKWLKEKAVEIKLVHKLLRDFLYAAEPEELVPVKEHCAVDESGSSASDESEETSALVVGRRSAQQSMKKNKFNNFDQRVYDNEELERLLFGQA